MEEVETNNAMGKDEGTGADMNGGVGVDVGRGTVGVVDGVRSCFKFLCMRGCGR